MARKVILLLAAAFFFSGCSLPGFLQAKYAALQITTSAQAKVSLDGEEVGETPFKSEKLKAKEHTVRLVPKESGLESWETAVTLKPNITTVINYEFAQEKQLASGEIISLEQLADSQAVEIAIVSIPDNASVKLDGQPKGFTPAKIKDIEAGDHSLTVSAPGFKQKRIDVKTIEGHRLTVDVQLAQESLVIEEETTPSPESTTEEGETPSPTSTKPSTPAVEPEPPYVEILDTPTGWLRVRSSPTTAEENEITKLDPGETYPYIESNEKGWHKILLPDGTEGWISGRYVKLYE